MNNAAKRRLNVSPSQLKKFETCPRLTAWQLCTRVKPPPGPPDARALGERAHALAESWLLEGKRPDPTETIEVWRKLTKDEQSAVMASPDSRTALGPDKPIWTDGRDWRTRDLAYVGAIALSHLQTLPAPKTPGLEVEVAATVTTPAATYKARADYRHRAFGVSTIGDHKFVGDLSYALTNRPGSVNGFKEPNYLGDDVQAIVQAKAEFEADPALACVSLAWHYTQTKAVRGEYPTRVVRLTLTREQVDLAMQAIDPVAAQISTVFDLQIQPHALPPRLAVNGGCDRIYGRPCEFASHCNLTLQEKQDQFMNTPSESQQRLAAALEAAKKLTDGSFLNAAPVAPSTPPTTPTTPPTPEFNLPAFSLPLGPTFVVPTFAPPPAFTPPAFAVPIVAPPEIASAPPAFVVPAFAPPAFAPTFVGTADTGPLLSGDRFVAAILADMEPEERAALANLLDPINPPEAPPNDGTFGPLAAAKRVEEVEIPGGDLEALDRAAAKKICVQRGLVAASSRLGVEALRDLIRKADAGVPIERVDMAQFVPSVEETWNAIALAGPSSAEDVDPIAHSAAIDDERTICLSPSEAHSEFVREVRAALDDLNRVGDRLRALIGA